MKKKRILDSHRLNKKQGTMKISPFAPSVVSFLCLVPSHIITITAHILRATWNWLCIELHSCAAVFFYNFWKEAPDSNPVKNIDYPLGFVIIFLCPNRPRPITSRYSQFTWLSNYSSLHHLRYWQDAKRNTNWSFPFSYTYLVLITYRFPFFHELFPSGQYKFASHYCSTLLL